MICQVEKGSLSQSRKPISGTSLVRLYRGFPVYAICSVPSYVVYVSTYTCLKSKLGFSLDKENDPAKAAMAPLIAGVRAHSVHRMFSFEE